MAATVDAPTAENRPAGAQRDLEVQRRAPLKAGEDPQNTLAASLKDAAAATLLAGVLGFFFLALRGNSGVKGGGLHRPSSLMWRPAFKIASAALKMRWHDRSGICSPLSQC